MKNYKKTLKSIVLSMVLAAGMMLPASVMAQEEGRGGGLFGRGDIFESDGWFRGLLNEEDEELEGDMTNQTFETPLGGGIAILLAAGLGYVALKKKEDEQ